MFTEINYSTWTYVPEKRTGHLTQKTYISVAEPVDAPANATPPAPVSLYPTLHPPKNIVFFNTHIALLFISGQTGILPLWPTPSLSKGPPKPCAHRS